MMRKIKFRGKAENVAYDDYLGGYLVKEDEWVFGNLVTSGNGFYWIVGDVVEATTEYINLEFWCPVKLETIGQYTGIKDRNGEAIFGGDIIIHKEFPKWDQAVVEFREGAFYARNVLLSHNHHSLIEIVGNIHD